jgi:hypothetical protein
MAQPKTYRKDISVPVTEDMKDRLQQMADEAGLPLTQLVRNVLASHIKSADRETAIRPVIQPFLPTTALPLSVQDQEDIRTMVVSMAEAMVEGVIGELDQVKRMMRT